MCKAFDLQICWQIENSNVINMCRYDKTVDSKVFLTSQLKKCMLSNAGLKIFELK